MTLIRPDIANSAVMKNCVNFRKKINNTFSVDIPIKTDWVDKNDSVDPNAPEIILGNTTRPASIELLASLPENSYAIKITENQIIINATNDSLLAYALYDFEKNYLNNDEYRTETGFSIPVGADTLVTSDEMASLKNAISSGKNVSLSINNMRGQDTIPPYLVGQGATSDGTYFYLPLIKTYSDGTQTAIIVKRRMDDWSLVATSEELHVDHANDICYDSDKNILVVAHNKENILSILDPDTLTITEQIHIDIGSTTAAGISYNSSRKSYCVTTWVGKIFILDSDFNVTSSINMITANDYVAQGVDSDDMYIYTPKSGAFDNIIIVYSWDTGYVTTLTLDTTMESESITNYDGNYYISFNSAGIKICDLDFSILFE